MKRIVISLGGSLIYPDSIDISFIKGFKLLIESYLKKDYSFVIICGGGKLARDFQIAAERITTLEDKDKDWLGISATKMNASLMKLVFEEHAYEKIITDPTEKIKTEKKVLICAGWKPGWSTDFDAVKIAENVGAGIVINMSNIDYVYDSDPKKNMNAKPLKTVSWKDFRELVGDTWSPGLNMPFDPVAAKAAEKISLKVIIIGGSLENFRNVLDAKDFIGTTIG